ncbi:Myb-like protein J [Gossypium australe]|uniref:Myb-like protein J n=1 Tax=Gossypium australe TaxID=47621 RepID=A0A5B6X2M2_9ROSI|nr:Myb-like protein J [Gossypium australe]
MSKDRRRSIIHNTTSADNGDISAPQGPITGQQKMLQPEAHLKNQPNSSVNILLHQLVLNLNFPRTLERPT